MSRKRTALEYLIEEYAKHCDGDGLIPFEIIEIANDMDKEQKKAAYNQGYRDGEKSPIDVTESDIANYANAEIYYNDTYTI
jgi:hypothetical protein